MATAAAAASQAWTHIVQQHVRVSHAQAQLRHTALQQQSIRGN
jgi:hypothetical protein